MSLMKTLAKVAIGVAVAKGAGAMMKKSGGASQASAGGGLGGLLGGLAGGGASAGGGGAGGLQDMLGGLMGGGSGGAGGLGGLLEGLGGAQGGQQGGGLQGMLGGLAGAGGAGGLMGALSGAMAGGGAQAAPAAPNNASFGQVLNSAFDANPEPAIEPSADQEAAAGLMLRAMIQAAKSDGKLDDAEREKLIGQLGDEVDSQEAQFVQTEMQAPIDVDGLVSQVPRGMEPQVYAMSVIAINLDSQAEAKYLHQLAQGLGLNTDTVNDVHAQLGVPSLYT